MKLFYFLSALTWLAVAWNFGGDYYSGKWLGFGILGLALTAIQIHKKYGAAAATCISFCTASMLYMLLYSGNRYSTVQPYDAMALKLFSTESMLKLYMVIVPLLIFRIDLKRLELWGGMAACAFLFVSIGQVFLELVTDGCSIVNSCGGVLRNPSLNACMMAICLPIVFKYFANPWRWLLLVLTAGAAVLGKSNMGIGMTAVFTLLHLGSRFGWRALIAVPPFAGLGWYFLGAKFMSSGDRFMMWELFMSKWAVNPNHWFFGTGFGTFGVFSKNIQQHFLPSSDKMWWIWLHNDWLQGLFETGIVGLGLMIWLYTAALRGLIKRALYPEAQSLVLFGLAMGGNYPLHVALPCVFLAWLLCLSLYKNEAVLHTDLET